MGRVLWDEFLEEAILLCSLLHILLKYGECVCRTSENHKSLVLQDKCNMKYFCLQPLSASQRNAFTGGQLLDAYWAHTGVVRSLAMHCSLCTICFHTCWFHYHTLIGRFRCLRKVTFPIIVQQPQCVIYAVADKRCETEFILVKVKFMYMYLYSDHTII